jgi:hypothetical protein
VEIARHAGATAVNRCMMHGAEGRQATRWLVRSLQIPSAMNSKLALREMPGFLPPRGRKSAFPPDGVSIKWPSVDGWLSVADEATRTAYAASCAALALEQNPEMRDTACFLKRRAEMLLRLVETLTSESRCEARIRAMSESDVLTGMRQAEERLSGKVRGLLSSKGLKLPMIKLLEQEYFFNQTSLAQIKLAQMGEKALG